MAKESAEVGTVRTDCRSARVRAAITFHFTLGEPGSRLKDEQDQEQELESYSKATRKPLKAPHYDDSPLTMSPLTLSHSYQALTSAVLKTQVFSFKTRP